MVQRKSLKEKLEILDEYFYYDGGEIVCKKAYHKRPLGVVTGTVTSSGHTVLRLKGMPFLKHRAIFFIVYRYLPEFIDHIDRNPQNNFIENLRAATKATNSWNRGVQSNSATGIRGVTYNNNPNSVSKWGAYIKINGKRIWIGSFKTKELAEEAYQQTFYKCCETGEIIP